MRESVPIARETSVTSASVTSHSAEIALIDEMRCARNAFAVSLASSVDHTSDVLILSRGIHCVYTEISAAAAARPASVLAWPISVDSGDARSIIAVPAEKKAGLEMTSWRTLAHGGRRIFAMIPEVRTGTVERSTTTLGESASDAMCRAFTSQKRTSGASPAPMPAVLIGVFTATKISSASRITRAMSFTKNRLLLRDFSTTVLRPGS
mmetsp:Transcript_23835/g.61399  ORF Transcript_23835/g.61399 Transcript_23835/m.61399 type:complete len:208 (+) Transcript_23835:1176-1799(+)